MKTILATTVIALAFGTLPVAAQYVGPNGAANTVKQLLDSGRNHDPVMLTGHITSRTAYKDLYNFSDGTGTVFIKINQKNWPRNLTVDDKTKVEIVGKFDREFVGFDKVKVIDIRTAAN